MSKFKEDDLQMAVARYLDHTSLIWFHPANERRTSIQAGARLKRKGVKPGVPDVMILTPNSVFNGLAIELKIKPNKPTPKQKEWLKSLLKCGWRCEVVYSLDEFLLIIKDYEKT